MQVLDSIMRNTISPQKEMLAYETLWAIRDIKEAKLRQYFGHYTPSETLREIQPDLFKLKDKSIKEEVKSFLDKEVNGTLKTFSIIVNKNFQYPKSLMREYPTGLFYYKGNLDILNTKTISIVGTRKVSEIGRSITKKLVKELVAENFTIVSGLAEGIDTVAHESAIENRGNTIAVIGTPINQCYPKKNQKLQDKIANEFLLISHVPFYRYAKEPFSSHRYHFPRRNMTMASLSLATVIVEASDTSGSLIQARECFKHNKKLFILDSCFTNPNITWPAKYEKKGAIRVKGTQDILEYFNES